MLLQQLLLQQELEPGGLRRRAGPAGRGRLPVGRLGAHGGGAAPRPGPATRCLPPPRRLRLQDGRRPRAARGGARGEGLPSAPGAGEWRCRPVSRPGEGYWWSLGRGADRLKAVHGGPEVRTSGEKAQPDLCQKSVGARAGSTPPPCCLHCFHLGAGSPLCHQCRCGAAALRSRPT